MTANSLHVMKMCQAFAQEGYDITLYAIQGDLVDEMGKAVWQRYGIRERFEITWMNPRASLRGYNVALTSVWNAKMTGTELVYTRNIVAAALASMIGIPTILELHDMPGGRFGLQLTRVFVAGNGFVRLVTISDALRLDVQQRFRNQFNDLNCMVVHDAVDLERFANMPTMRSSREMIGIANTFTVGYAGSFYPGRGVELICRIASMLPEVQFLVVGGDPKRLGELRSNTSRGTSANLVFLGFVDNDKLPVYLAACDALLLPYQHRVSVSGGGNTVKYMSPLKLFEYMAAERLIISSDLPVLREILNEQNAAFCPPDYPESWCRMIQRAMTDDTWRQSLARNARCEVENHTWRRRVHRCLSGIV